MRKPDCSEVMGRGMADHHHIKLTRTRVVEADGVTHVQFEFGRTP